MFIFFTGQRPCFIYLIFAQLGIANIMLLFFRGIPLVILNWKNKYFLDDVGCKIVFYLQRVGRGVSICSTCLLSIYQIIIINSHSAKWANLRKNAPKYSLIFSAFCWVLNAVIYVFIPISVIGPVKQQNVTRGIDIGYCYWKYHLDYAAFIYVVRDVFFVCLMIFCCAYLVHFLHNHHQLVQHIHGAKITPSKNPEIKATKRIVLLVITFFSFYSINGILLLCNIYFLHSSVWLLDTSAFMTLCFPTFSPFLLTTSNNHIVRWCANFGR
ncbi:PREDICTED: vomeronasal type-1 receptor 4-like [Chrysochloris asiatica]|uniref:Vomeronasal type-1 receptor n=1 Tax=Chrysochloris asiatica TaxID=185453 RepID=A0A9B0WYT3_CHRAS|nr:PREDICTED: vomeronasal type-1 receptor 4-like [Chrysochloris asiatica]